VRGYPEGEYLADRGVTLNVEWAFPHVVMAFKRLFTAGCIYGYGWGNLKSVGSGEHSTGFLWARAPALDSSSKRIFFSGWIGPSAWETGQPRAGAVKLLYYDAAGDIRDGSHFFQQI